MEIFGMSLTVLINLLIVDIVLSGDNAVVIAMATRNVQKEKQKIAILCGTAGAILLRILFAAIVVWLLKIPFLHLIGGILLVWIALKLLLPEKEEQLKEGGTSLWSAIRTIIIADAVMSLDNVIALVGVSHGNIAAIVLGVAISIPIIIYGSRIILKAMERWPIITYVGAAILAWTAGGMIAGEPRLAEYVNESLILITKIVITILVVVIGYIISNNNNRIITSEKDVRQVLQQTPIASNQRYRR